MLLSALSAAATCLFAMPGISGQVGAKERQIWQGMQDSVVQIVRDGRGYGSAALVDSKGLFLTHLGTVYANRVSGRLADGRTVTLYLKSSDGPTQLAVLQADDWIRRAEPLLPATKLKPGETLLAVLPSGIIRAEFVTSKRLGVVSTSRSLMPLSEISFEAPADSIGGAMVVTTGGRLVGFLNAALHTSTDANTQIKPMELNAEGDEGARAPMMKAARALLGSPVKRFGPADMTVAYTPAPNSLQQAMKGLLQGKDVQRPSIGVDVKNAKGGGALIAAVHPGSSAEEAGIKQGDVVLEIDSQPIQDQVDLARIVMEHEVGSSMRIKLKRGRQILIVPVRVQSRTGKSPADPASAT